jgi:hypothetical protein
MELERWHKLNLHLHFTSTDQGFANGSSIVISLCRPMEA